MHAVESLSTARQQSLGLSQTEGLSCQPLSGATFGELSRGPLVPFPRRYRYLGRIGKGAQGAVHLCDDLRQPGRRVVIKVARPLGRARHLIEKESRVLWSLRHSDAVPEIRGLLYRRGRMRGFIMPYLPGATLEVELSRGSWWAERIRSVSLATADAILDVLSRGYLHRDLKPENLLVLSGGQVKVLDFGLARRADERPGEGEISGTFAYAAPEQLQARRLGPRSDLFSLGLILYEIAKGRRFFSRDLDNYRSFMVYRAQRLARPMDLGGVEPSLAALIRRLVVASPARRAGLRETRDLLDRVRLRASA